MMLLSLMACTTVVDFPPPMVWDSGTWSDSGTSTTGDPLFAPMAWEATCDESGWSYRLKVEGWVGGATLDVVQTGGGWERHALGIVASDPEGHWDQLGLGPLPIVDRPDQEADSSTRFPCDAPLSMVVRVEDAAGELLSCAVAGEDPSGALAAVRQAEPELKSLGGCTVF